MPRSPKEEKEFLQAGHLLHYTVSSLKLSLIIKIKYVKLQSFLPGEISGAKYKWQLQPQNIPKKLTEKILKKIKTEWHEV